MGSVLCLTSGRFSATVHYADPPMNIQKEVIDKYTQKELNLGRIAGPFEKGDLQPPVHIDLALSSRSTRKESID